MNSNNYFTGKKYQEMSLSINASQAEFISGNSQFTYEIPCLLIR